MRTLGDFGDQGARKLCRLQKRRENRVSVAGNRHLSRENRVICVSRETKKHKGGKNLSSLGTPRSNVCVCRCDVQIACFQDVRTKLSHTSKRQYKAVSHGVIKVCYLFGKAQSGKSAGQPYQNKLCNRKVSNIPFPFFCFLFQISINVSEMLCLTCETAVVSYIFL